MHRPSHGPMVWSIPFLRTHAPAAAAPPRPLPFSMPAPCIFPCITSRADIHVGTTGFRPQLHRQVRRDLVWAGPRRSRRRVARGTVEHDRTPRTEREFPVLVWYALKINSRKKSRWRAKNQKTHSKTAKTPGGQKAQKTPPKGEKIPIFFFALTREKETALFKKLIVFAGTPRRPATPGIPALAPRRPAVDVPT